MSLWQGALAFLGLVAVLTSAILWVIKGTLWRRK